MSLAVASETAEVVLIMLPILPQHDTPALLCSAQAPVTPTLTSTTSSSLAPVPDTSTRPGVDDDPPAVPRPSLPLALPPQHSTSPLVRTLQAVELPDFMWPLLTSVTQQSTTPSHVDQLGQRRAELPSRFAPTRAGAAPPTSIAEQLAVVLVEASGKLQPVAPAQAQLLAYQSATHSLGNMPSSKS